MMTKRFARPLLCLLLGAFTGTSLMSQSAAIISQVETTEKAIALTFDDGPDPMVLDFLAVLDAEAAKATFFVIGNKIEKHPEILRKAMEAGHEVANHSYTHPKLPSLTEEAIDEEIVKTQKEIEQHLGFTPTLFRAPYLQYNDTLKTILAREGLTGINADVDVRDWDSATTVDLIIERATENARPGSIILMHSWSKKTLEALPEIIRTLKDRGYRFVTVSELRALEAK